MEDLKLSEHVTIKGDFLIYDIRDICQLVNLKQDCVRIRKYWYWDDPGDIKMDFDCISPTDKDNNLRLFCIDINEFEMAIAIPGGYHEINKIYEILRKRMFETAGVIL